MSTEMTDLEERLLKLAYDKAVISLEYSLEEIAEAAANLETGIKSVVIAISISLTKEARSKNE